MGVSLANRTELIIELCQQQVEVKENEAIAMSLKRRFVLLASMVCGLQTSMFQQPICSLRLLIGLRCCRV